MYLYIPKAGRSIVTGEYTISSTGMAFPERVAELDSVVGILLDLEHDEDAVAVAPEIASVPETPLAE